MARASRRWAETVPGILLVVAGTFAALVCGAARAQDLGADELNDVHIQAAIGAIVDELYERKEAHRFWDPAIWTSREHGSESQTGGYTALVTLALLYAGESYQDPRLRDAVEYLEQLELEGTYAVATRAHVWSLLPRRFLPRLEADAEWLASAFSERAAGWDYTSKPRTTRLDNSLRQYGALGLWEAAKRGVTVDARIWQRLEEGFIESQLRDGGWNYQADEAPARGSMTAAGLTVLFITQDFLHGREDLDLGARRDAINPALGARTKGLTWMEQNFAPDRNPGRDLDFYYYLYGIERVGMASGYKRFGEHDWYREGAAELLRRLCAWDAERGTMSVHRKTAGDGNAARIRTHQLAFALMFLSRGRVPIAFNKLNVDGIAWNNRPRDVARLTRSISDASETGLSWQIVDANAPPETWLDAPVLYFASHEALPWVDQLNVDDTWERDVIQWSERRARGEISASTPPPGRPTSIQLDAMKRYLDLGGMLFAVNEGDGERFASSVERMGTLLYPALAWRDLPADHFLYTSPRPIEGNRVKLRALGNGVRELIVLARADLARSFQDPEPRDTRVLDLGSNIYFYASELGRPRPRLAQHVAPTRDSNGSTPISIVHAIHEGHWQPEPLATTALRTMLGKRHDLAVTLVEHSLQRIDTLPRRPELVIVQGIDAHDFSEPERAAIKAYVEAGGVILFETPGGRGDFTMSAESMATELFQRGPRRLSRNRIVTGRDLEGGRRLSRIDYRPYSLQVFESRENAPRLRGITIDGQPRVIFSREDLAHALLDQPCWGIAGYTPDAARDLLSNIVLHAIDVARGG